ncbi:MAG TPA: FAD-dependent oxidoreductase, partial [candidate division Zixibacteria bacterium]|nr:FAD-dependent oxidoreductase [candidate division Zixibacteria bacterium]
MREFDLVVIGSGPAGEKAAIEAAKMRRSTAIVERRSVQGGVCIHTGTIPSKTLRETVLYISGLRQRSVYGLVGGVRANVSVA